MPHDILRARQRNRGRVAVGEGGGGIREVENENYLTAAYFPHGLILAVNLSGKSGIGGAVLSSENVKRHLCPHLSED